MEILLLDRGVHQLSQNEFVDNPRDIIANMLLHSVQNLSVGGQDFAAIYLLGHGIVKLRLMIVNSFNLMMIKTRT